MQLQVFSFFFLFNHFCLNPASPLCLDRYNDCAIYSYICLGCRMILLSNILLWLWLKTPCLLSPSSLRSLQFTNKHFMGWSENDSSHESLWWVVKAIFMMPHVCFSPVQCFSCPTGSIDGCVYFCRWSHGRPENGHLLYNEWVHVSQLHWTHQQFHQYVLLRLHPQEERQCHRLPVSPTLNYSTFL